MRSYGQYCALARGLDVIGDRWSLLIVRELLLRGPSRYTDLRDGLPGIATNLLAERLRSLEASGIVEREDAPPPIATTLFKLTERGERLKPAVVELGRWAAPLMREPVGGDAFRTHWFALPVELYLADRFPDRPPVTIELRAGEQAMTLETADGEIETRLGSAEDPDAVLSGDPRLVIGVLAGELDLAEARSRGLGFEGDAKALRRLQPRPRPAVTA
jgi:DNA-binding HxlR family transcriptional regulator